MAERRLRRSVPVQTAAVVLALVLASGFAPAPPAAAAAADVFTWIGADHLSLDGTPTGAARKLVVLPPR